jgi:hypothetical protein
MEAQYHKAYFMPDLIAAAYAAVGDKDKAFAWLERDFESRSWVWIFAPHFSFFKPLTQDARWGPFMLRVKAAER